MSIADFPSSIREAQKSLAPFIKSRSETSRIRRLLTAHLHTQLDFKHGEPVLGPMALLSELDDANIAPGTARGLRREYLKSLKANVKARHEYEKLSNPITNKDVKVHDPEPLQDFVTLVKLRQRHERLRIIQDHVINLSRKYHSVLLSPDSMSRDSASLPRIPLDLVEQMDSRGTNPTVSGLKGLTQDLEKSILRSKSQLQEEKLLLSQVKRSRSISEIASHNHDRENTGILQALGETRNELITWVEDELSKAGDSRWPETNAKEASPPRSKSSVHNDDRLSAIRIQYERYLQARKDIIEAVSHSEKDPNPLGVSKDPDLQGTGASSDSMTSNSRIIGPPLQDLTLLSSEQKTVLQHRSYLTISLAKQHKDTIQIFDRLASESHLLPTHPFPSARKSALLSDETTSKETPSAFHLAQAWAYASEAARSTTKDDVMESIDQGLNSIDDSQKAILAINSLLGKASAPGTKSERIDEVEDEEDVWISETISQRNRTLNIHTESHSVWNVLDGDLGMIQKVESS